MTDNLHTWLNERETIHDNGGEYLSSSRPESVKAMVDAYYTLPKLVRGVKAVLDLCDQWDEDAGSLIPGMPGIENDEAFKIRMALQEAISDE